MAENLRRAFAKSFVFKSFEAVKTIGDHLHIKGSGLDSDVVVWFDSDSFMLYTAQRLEEQIDSDRAWEKIKLSYKYYDGGFGSLPMTMVNAYNINTFPKDKNEIYSFGYVLSDSDRIWLFDSEGPRVLKPKAKHVGTQASGFDSESAYMYDQSFIDSVSIYYGMSNKLNGDFSSTQLDFPSAKIIIRGRNLLTDSDDSPRFFSPSHIGFSGIQPPFFWIENGEQNVGIIQDNLYNSHDSPFNWYDSDKKSYGAVYPKLRSKSPSNIILETQTHDFDVPHRFHYVTEFNDSELTLETPYTFKDVDFPEVIDSEFQPLLLTNFNVVDGEEKPWKVFNDSDNAGFKAALGIHRGYIGWGHFNEFQPTRLLTKVIIKNTFATPPDNRPYDFDVEIYDPINSVWVTADAVRGFTGYIYEKEFTDSDVWASAIRINFLHCQPGFDSDVNALEVKTIRFETKERKLPFLPIGAGWFITTPDSDYFITIGDSDQEASGLIIGAGAGGGYYVYGVGGGGGGGGYCRIDNIVLKAGHTYRIRIGSGTGRNKAGNPSILEDVTAGKILIYAGGGGTGSTTGSFGGTANGGKGGKVTVWDSEDVIEWFDSDGGEGGRYHDQTETPGKWGFQSDVSFYSTPLRVNTVPNYDLCSGGGTGTWIDTKDGFDSFNAGAFNNGPSAGNGNGRPLYTSGSTSAPANRGGGGGGGGMWVSSSSYVAVNAGNGGSGYAYLIFK